MLESSWAYPHGQSPCACPGKVVLKRLGEGMCAHKLGIIPTGDTGVIPKPLLDEARGGYT